MRLVLLFVIFLFPVQASAALIAEVRTSAGNFSIDLNYIGARRTVSHFYQLATGSRPWLDEKTGQIRTGVPFYNGLTFHKKEGFFGAIAPKYIQTGARYPDDPDVFIPNDKQGCGYVIRDEVRHYAGTSALIVPHGLYTVSMANTGPHSGSSQFFINLINDSSWNERNSAFGTVEKLFKVYNSSGQVTGVTHNGWAVVNAIHASNQPVTIQSITFRITNNTPSVFDPTAYDDEFASFGRRQIISLAHDPVQVTLGYAPVTSACETRIWTSTDLFDWSPFPHATTFTPGNTATSIGVNHGGSLRLFFQSTVTAYPVSTVPANLYGKRIRITKGKPHSLPAVSVVQLEFDPYGFTDTYYRYADASAGSFTYTLTPKGPFHADLEVTYDTSETETYQLFFGGANLTVTENEQMRAWIFPTGGGERIEACWRYL